MAKAKKVEKALKIGTSKEARREQAAKINEALAQEFPNAKCALIHDSPLQLLIATMLSAQCTDARVNMVTPGLFKKYPDAASFAKASQEEIEHEIRSTGFYRNKARSIREASHDIMEKHGGQVPNTLEALTALRGVGRKTANVVLGNAFAVPGMVVDTHVMRLSQRLGLTREKTPEKIELDLMPLMPDKLWVMFGHRLILHGRKYCKAPNPNCTGCPLERICPYPQKRFKI
jgi:endonuclease-3